MLLFFLKLNCACAQNSFNSFFSVPAKSHQIVELKATLKHFGLQGKVKKMQLYQDTVLLNTNVFDESGNLLTQYIYPTTDNNFLQVKKCIYKKKGQLVKIKHYEINGKSKNLKGISTVLYEGDKIIEHAFEDKKGNGDTRQSYYYNQDGLIVKKEFQEKRFLIKYISQYSYTTDKQIHQILELECSNNGSCDSIHRHILDYNNEGQLVKHQHYKKPLSKNRFTATFYRYNEEGLLSYFLGDDAHYYFKYNQDQDLIKFTKKGMENKTILYSYDQHHNLIQTQTINVYSPIEDEDFVIDRNPNVFYVGIKKSLLQYKIEYYEN
ncbi:hypothetical protein [Aureispira sp. CCB-QB1]|uniref:hypothetical protein n=1 Tax=Aureispira sp. CCB-QB1 TaxID=1313421 RepID=UPI0012DE6F34|nr:hypothetical protein [Aureispira sp. CCB-QB1]